MTEEKTCPIAGCETRLPDRLMRWPDCHLLCSRHWELVPSTLKHAFWEAARLFRSAKGTEWAEGARQELGDVASDCLRAAILNAPAEQLTLAVNP